MSQFWKFSKDATTAGAAEKYYLGGKGVGLVEMARAGLPVPPGVIIPTVVCPQVFSDKSGAVLKATAKEAMALAVEVAGPGSLFSVRSGAAVSMPGMMDTILNVGIHKDNVEGYAKTMGNKAALDCYRRLIEMYGKTVAGIEGEKFAAVMKKVKGELTVPKLEKLVAANLAVYEKHAGEFPATLEAQLEGAIGAVFKSWNSERAIAYRIEHKIPHDMYTACIVQRMVFGNLNANSCSGVLFSRDPTSGEKQVYGDFLSGGQGEEVVSGSANTKKIAELAAWNSKVSEELFTYVQCLEAQYRDMVDTEFTVENGTVYMLQVRTGKREALAAFRIAYDMVKESVITKAEALKRVSAAQYAILSRPQIAANCGVKPQITGVGASKGVATGRAWFSSKAAQLNKGGILVSHETTPDDFAGMAASVGILTKTGGSTSHAAVVARAMNRACVVGCNGALDFSGAYVIFKKGQPDAYQIVEGDVITIDGSTGNVYVGAVPMVGGKVPEFVNEMIEWGAQGVALQYDAAKDTLPTTGELYVSMVNVKTVAEVSEVFMSLSDDCHGILSFIDASKFDDSEFLNALCLDAQVMSATDEQIDGLINVGASEKAKKWTVIGSHVQAHNFKVHKKLTTLGDLFNASGYYEIDSNLEKLLEMQGTTVAATLDILKDAGAWLTPITKPVTREQMAFQVFGK